MDEGALREYWSTSDGRTDGRMMLSLSFKGEEEEQRENFPASSHPSVRFRAKLPRRQRGEEEWDLQATHSKSGKD